ncbi:MAG: cytochrome c-type biogenesis protein CcmH [Alphaproteobacteria bacterium]|nr:cytochrome c-type biogenesis protein CcmH [Alphaproteobacteria bacterium]
MLDDPTQEARARALSADIRCLVCQNQSIDDSDASLAKDMRLLVREQIKDGKTDQQIRDFLVARYGDFVLLNPPVKRSTWLLWFGPLLVLIAGIASLALYFRSRAKQIAPAADGLSADEQAQLDKLLRDEDRAP